MGLLRAGSTHSSRLAPRTAYIAPRPCFQSPAGPRALRGARIVLLLRRSRRGPRSEHLARPAGPTRPSVSAASLYGLPLRLPFAVLRQARRDRTGTIGPQVLASLPVCSPIERIRPASSPEGGGTPRSTEAQGHHWRPHAAHPNPACSGLAPLAADAAVRCGHSSNCGPSTGVWGEQAPAEPSDWCCGREEPGQVKRSGGTPVGEALPNRRQPTGSAHLRVAMSGRRPPLACGVQPVSVSRTSWRSNRAGPLAVPPGGINRSPLPARHSRRLHGFLLRASTPGLLQLAFVARRRPQGVCNGNHRSTGYLCSSPRCGTGPPGTSVGPRWRSGVLHATRATVSPPHLTPGCSGLAALVAEPIG